MTYITTTTLYYDDDEPPSLLGRVLTKYEYDNITADELRDAINNSIFMFQIGIGGEGDDLHPTPETERAFNALSVEQLKEALQKHNALLIRSNEPLDQNVFPVFTKGPRKGQLNFKKKPETFFDRWYCVEFSDTGVVGKEGKIFLQENGTFTVLEKVSA